MCSILYAVECPRHNLSQNESASLQMQRNYDRSNNEDAV